MTLPPQALTDRIEAAVWEGLNEAAAADRPAESGHDAGRQLRPSMRACLEYLHCPSSPLRRPGPRGQLGLLD